MSKHTEGPWHVWGGTELCVKAGKRSIACASQETMTDWETAKANARLIAAAPELLEALELLMFWLNSGASPSLQSIQTAKQAIAKAKGEA